MKAGLYFNLGLVDNALPNTHPAVSTLQVVSVNGSSKLLWMDLHN